MFLLTFIAILLSLTVSQGSTATLKCNFGNNTLGYGCASFDLFKEDDAVTVVSDRHLRRFNNALVVYFWIPPKANTNFVPLKLCNQFSDLKKMVIQGKLISSISRQVFEECKELELLWISGTKINWLAEDSFEDLSGLESLYLNDNQLKYLPSKLFDNNLKLHTFQATGNHLEVIELQFAESVNFVNLEKNNCVARNVNGSDVSALNKFIEENCASSKQKHLNTELKNLRLKLREFTTEFELLKLDLKKADFLKDGLINHTKVQSIKIEQLEQENDNYQEQVSAFSASVVHLKQQLEYHENAKMEAQKSVVDLEKERFELNQTLISHQQTLLEMNDTSESQKLLINDLMRNIFNLTFLVEERDVQLENLTLVNIELHLEKIKLEEAFRIPTTENPEDEMLIEELRANLTICLEKVYELELATERNVDNSATLLFETTFVTQTVDDINEETFSTTRFIRETTKAKSFEDDVSSKEKFNALTSIETENNQSNESSTKTTDDDEDNDEEDYDEATTATVSTKRLQTQQINENLCKGSLVFNNLQEELLKLKNNLSFHEKNNSKSPDDDELDSIVESSEVYKTKIQELESKVNEMEKLSILLAVISVAALIALLTLILKILRKRQKFSTRSSAIELKSNEKYQRSAPI